MGVVLLSWAPAGFFQLVSLLRLHFSLPFPVSAQGIYQSLRK